MKFNSRNSPIFIIGVQRSGTTIIAELLKEMIGSGIVVNGKLAYYLSVWLVQNVAEWSGDHARLDEVAHALSRVPPKHVTPQLLHSAIETLLSSGPDLCRSSATSSIALTRLWYLYQAVISEQAAVVGEKYNELLLHLGPLLDAFQDARIIFIYREPRDVVESMVRHFQGRPWVPISYEEAAIKYLKWNMQWEINRQRIRPENRFEICYDLFVERPNEVLIECCKWLDIDVSNTIGPISLDVSRRGHGADVPIDSDPLRAAVDWYEHTLDRVGKKQCPR